MSTDGLSDRSKGRTHFGSASFSASATLTAYLTGMSRFGSGWLSDALNESQTEAMPTIHNRRREIVFAANAAESYLLEWVAQQFWNQNQSYSEVHDALVRHFPPPAWNRNKKFLNQALQAIKEAQDPSASNEAIQAALTEARSHVSQVVSSKQQNLESDWFTIPKAVATELGFSDPTFNERVRKDFAELIQLRNKVVHAGLSWPRGFKPSKDGPTEPTVTVERIMGLPNAFASWTVMDLIQALHDSTETEMIPLMSAVAERFRRGFCPFV